MMSGIFTFEKTIQDALPVLTIVTISASASEMNGSAVITNEDSAHKFSTSSPFLQPRTSILDPTVLYTLTPSYSAYSAVDTITHMLEGYFNNTLAHSPLQDRLVEGLIQTVMESTVSILKDPHDYAARANMMWSATLAFNGLTTAGMGLIRLPAHMIEHSCPGMGFKGIRTGGCHRYIDAVPLISKGTGLWINSPEIGGGRRRYK